MRVHGLLLAAGAGSRMGMPKALVSDDRGPWLARGVRTLRDGGCVAVTVVLGAAVEEALPLLDGLDATVVVADDWAEGMSASLRAGLHALEETDADAAVVHLVDLPDVGPAVVERVVGRVVERVVGRVVDGGAALARATYDGVPGHPVLLGREHWAPVVADVTGDRGARGYVGSHETLLVECGDLATGADVDRFG